MVQVIQYFCNSCKTECLPREGLATFAGFMVKIDAEKLEPKNVGFEGHYCKDCIEKILQFINDLKNAEDSSRQQVAKSPDAEGTDKGTK